MANQPADIDFGLLRRDITACTTIHDFVHAFNNPLHLAALQRLQHLLTAGDGNALNNARDWAIRMRTEPDEDRYVNECRKACLMLLYELCNRWKKTQTVTEEEIRTVFGRDRVLTILRAAMPLDCAQCLYKMQYAGLGASGMHWVAEQHIDAQPDVWNEKLRRVGGRSTMNKRYLWIAGLLGLPPANDPVLTACFTPQDTPWFTQHTGGEADAAMDGPDDINFEALESSINECDTAVKFLDVYNGRPFQAALRGLRIDVGTSDPIEWAKEWAIRMRDEPPSDENDPFCDSVRKVLLLFLDRLRVCALDDTNSAVSEATIVDTIGGHCIVNIVKLVLPMELAWCLRRRQNPDDVARDRYGMHWFSEADAGFADGPATIPPSFTWLRDIEGLGLSQEYLVKDWLKPYAPDWVDEEESDDEMAE